MDIQDFIEATLVNIAEGIRAANKRVSGKRPGGDSDLFAIRPEGEGAFVEFDIAVTVSQKKGKSAKAGANISVANIDGAKNDESSDESVSRIKFKVHAFKEVR